MWFNYKNIKKYPSIFIDNLHGYILPHAGTKYTGSILSRTLRFKPTKNFKYILIIYYPVNDKPNVKGFYHEYYVIMELMKQFFKDKIFIDYNIQSKRKPNISHLNNKNTLYVVSADFSHFLPMQTALKLENCAAYALMHKNLSLKCNNVVDNIKSFRKLYKLIPKSWVLQWVGRTRSSGLKGVGYLSFLIREKPKTTIKKPDAFFVTAYDVQMRPRECLGNTKEWSKKLENRLIKDVIYKAQTTSRLTGGEYLNIPIKNYTITYLYKDNAKKFIRGWHSILKDALYLPDVFLEHTYNNGVWISNKDTRWKSGNIFNLEDTFKKLQQKSGNTSKNKKYKLFYSEVLHKEI